MKTKELESTLRQMNYDFEPFFHTRVLARIEKFNESKYLKLQWKMLVPSLTLLSATILFTILQDGSLSLDSLLGITEYDTELEHFLMYF